MYVVTDFPDIQAESIDDMSEIANDDVISCCFHRCAQDLKTAIKKRGALAPRFWFSLFTLRYPHRLKTAR